MEERAPEVSIVMPAYNAAAYLRSAVESAMAQTFGDLELIVVDDGSTDATPSILAEFQAVDPRVRVITQANQGQSVARNRAIVASRGRFIAFLDADDLWDPCKLERQLPLFQDSNVGLVYSAVEDVDADGRPTRGPEPWDFHKGEILEHLLRSNFICTSSTVLRKSVLEKHGLQFTVGRLCEDWLLWGQLSCHATADFVPETLVRYRVHALGTSRKTTLMREGELACRADLMEAIRSRVGRLALDCARLLRIARLGMHTAYYSFARSALQEGDTDAALKHWKASVRFVPLRFGKVWRVSTFPLRILAGRLARWNSIPS